MNIEYVHKSNLNTIKRCSQQLYYKNIMQLKEKFVNESALTGRAFHKFAEEVYKKSHTNPYTEANWKDPLDKWNDVGYWIKFWIDELNREKVKAVTNDIEINYLEDIQAEDFVEMIGEFLKQPYNRYAEPVLIEAPFRFTIKQGRKEYKFAGTIDQLLKIHVKWLTQFKWLDLPKDKEYVYIHRDIKTGTRKTMSEIGLITDDNINVYSYALAFGMFDLSGTGEYSYNIHHIPFTHSIYYTRDHLKYKKSVNKLANGSYEHKAGDPKGQGMYFVKKPFEQLKMMEHELVNLHKRINSGVYTRDGAASNLCDHYCGFKDICLYDWKQNG